MRGCVSGEGEGVSEGNGFFLSFSTFLLQCRFSRFHFLPTAILSNFILFFSTFVTLFVFIYPHQ